MHLAASLANQETVVALLQHGADTSNPGGVRSFNKNKILILLVIKKLIFFRNFFLIIKIIFSLKIFF
jgi:hypothetical protein